MFEELTADAYELDGSIIRSRATVYLFLNTFILQEFRLFVVIFRTVMRVHERAILLERQKGMPSPAFWG